MTRPLGKKMGLLPIHRAGATGNALSAARAAIAAARDYADDLGDDLLALAAETDMERVLHAAQHITRRATCCLPPTSDDEKAVETLLDWIVELGLAATGALSSDAAAPAGDAERATVLQTEIGRYRAHWRGLESMRLAMRAWVIERNALYAVTLTVTAAREVSTGKCACDQPTQPEGIGSSDRRLAHAATRGGGRMSRRFLARAEPFSRSHHVDII